MPETLFALTSDDVGTHQPERFADLLSFLAERHVTATFFVQPLYEGVPLDRRPEWRELLQRAVDEGHEVQLHGLEHGVFEFGVPPGFMLDIIPEAKAAWQADPAAIQVNHALPILRSKIERGLEIFQRVFGHAPRGFRSGCLAVSDNQYQTLAEHGFRWASNLVVNPMGWRYINRDYDAGEPWDPNVPAHPFIYRAGVVEIPMLSEYTWYLRAEDVDRHFALAQDDFDRARALGGPFVTLSHYYAFTGEWSAGLQVYRRLFAHARATGQVRFCTLSQVLAQYPPRS
jgi:peptidoglycan/xylan/chitin deacetylase (PgdA/CDA1 family)